MSAGVVARCTALALLVSVASSLWIGGCEVAESDADPMAGGDVGDVEAGDSAAGGDGVETADSGPADADSGEPAPSPAGEQVVSLGGEVGEARDDLFPDLAGDDLVWVRVWLDLSVPGIDHTTDCFTCPYCGGCRFDVMYRRLPDGPAEVLAEVTQPRSGPRVGDGVVTWIDPNGRIEIHDLATGETTRIAYEWWVQSAPVPQGGKLWWYGYDPNIGQQGIMAYDRERDVSKLQIATYIQDPHWSPASQLSVLAQRAPLFAGEHELVYTEWTNTIAVRAWPYVGDAELVLNDPEKSHLRALVRPDGVIVTASYANEDGCSPATCELELTAFDGDEATPLAPDAEITRYVAPVLDGKRLVFVDHRDGPYQVHGVTPDGADVRLSSDEAVIGALSPIAAGDGRVVWADRRTDRWRLIARSW